MRDSLALFFFLLGGFLARAFGSVLVLFSVFVLAFVFVFVFVLSFVFVFVFGSRPFLLSFGLVPVVLMPMLTPAFISTPMRRLRAARSLVALGTRPLFMSMPVLVLVLALTMFAVLTFLATLVAPFFSIISGTSPRPVALITRVRGAILRVRAEYDDIVGSPPLELFADDRGCTPCRLR